MKRDLGYMPEADDACLVCMANGGALDDEEGNMDDSDASSVVSAGLFHVNLQLYIQ